MTQLSQGLRLNLANTFSGNIKLLTDLFKGVIGIHIDSKSHAQDLGFTRCQTAQYFAGRFGEPFFGSGFNR